MTVAVPRVRAPSVSGRRRLCDRALRADQALEEARVLRRRVEPDDVDRDTQALERERRRSDRIGLRAERPPEQTTEVEAASAARLGVVERRVGPHDGIGDRHRARRHRRRDRSSARHSSRRRNARPAFRIGWRRHRPRLPDAHGVQHHVVDQLPGAVQEDRPRQSDRDSARSSNSSLALATHHAHVHLQYIHHPRIRVN